MPLKTIPEETTEELMQPNPLKKGIGNDHLYSNLPVELQSSFNPGQTYLNPFEKPEFNRVPQEQHGFFGTLAHSFSENNELIQAGKSAYSFVEHLNALQDDRPADFTPYTLDALKDINQENWAYVTNAVSPKEQEQKRNFILHKQNEKESYENGSWLASFIGGSAGYLMGPSSLVLPVSSTIKYARASENVLKGLMQVSPSIGLQTVAHNAIIEESRVGGNLQDFLVNTAIDTTAGIALAGGAIGIGGTVTGGKLFAARKAMKLSHEGIDVAFNVNEAGQLHPTKPFIARPLPNTSLSAMEVSTAQDFLNSSAAKEGLFKLIPGATKVASIFSPVFRMLNSEFKTASEFANRLFDHSIITQGNIAGVANKQNFERSMWGIMNQSKQLGWELEGIRQEANGLETAINPDMAKKTFLQRLGKGQMYDKEEFGKQVSMAIRTGVPHANKHINEAATLLNKHLNDVYTRFLRAYGLSDKVLPPRTAVNYLMRNYDRNALNNNRQGWIDLVTNALKEQDELIAHLQTPLREAEEQLNALKSYKLGDTAEDRAIANEIEEARGRVNQEREKLHTEITDNPDYHILLESRNFLDSAQRSQLKSLLEPLKIQKDILNKQKDKVVNMKAKITNKTNLALKSKTEETKIKHTSDIEKLRVMLTREEELLERAELKLKELDAELNGRALNGEIDKNFYQKNPESGQIHFRDPYELPKFRKVYEDHNARAEAALAFRETILNKTPEQLGQQMLHSISGGNLENPLETRSIMIPDITLQNGKFLSNDLSGNLATYNLVVGKKTAFKEIFSNFGTEDGLKGITQEFNKEWRLRDAAISKLPEAERIKESQRLGKEFDKALSDITDAYKHAMGNTNGSRRLKAISRALRAFTVATRLGAVPLTMVTDLGAMFMSHSVLDVVRDGFLPFIKTFNGKLKTKDAEAYRESSAHLFIATEHLGNAMADKLWSNGSASDVSIGGKTVNALDNLAHLSGNFFGTNYLDNMLQRMAANITQSKVMRYMFRYQEGTLSKKELLFLNQHGLDPKEWSERFIENFKKSQGEEVNGGYYSKYYDWSDHQAVNKMGDAIRSGVRASILKKGLGDAPFLFNDPAWGMITHLKGWVFSAFTRYTIPLMQRPDAEKIIGMGFMLMLGSMVDPLRKWSAGEEYDFSDKGKFVTDAISNSGVGGIITDVIQDINAFTDQEFLGKWTNDRYRERSLMGIVGGPLGGIFDDIRHVGTAFGSGKINQQDMNRFIRLIPLSQAWFMRYGSNKLVEALDLPKNRQAATGWLGE